MFEGTYERLEDGSYQVTMKGGSAGYLDTTFEVEKGESDELIVNGGVFIDASFAKQ